MPRQLILIASAIALAVAIVVVIALIASWRSKAESGEGRLSRLYRPLVVAAGVAILAVAVALVVAFVDTRNEPDGAIVTAQAVAEDPDPPPDPTPEPAAPEPTPAPTEPVVLAVTDLGAPGDRAGVGPGLGVQATPDDIVTVDISIQPDGANLPAGQGTVAEGAAVYAEYCVACHGEDGAGGTGLVRLTGGVGTLAGDAPVKTVSSFWPYATTIFDYVRRAMPLNEPQSLTDEQIYAVVAYILSIDDIIGADIVLDANTLPAVEMPNRDGFVLWWPPPETSVAP